MQHTQPVTLGSSNLKGEWYIACLVNIMVWFHFLSDFMCWLVHCQSSSSMFAFHANLGEGGEDLFNAFWVEVWQQAPKQHMHTNVAGFQWHITCLCWWPWGIPNPSKPLIVSVRTQHWQPGQLLGRSESPRNVGQFEFQAYCWGN